MNVGENIKVTFIVYPIGYKPGDEIHEFDDFKTALEKAIEFGCDTDVVVDIEEENVDSTSLLYSPYTLTINLPYSDNMDEINKAVFGSIIS